MNEPQTQLKGHAMAELWRSLCVGDRIRFAHLPSEMRKPRDSATAHIRRLYEHLIATGIILTVGFIDERNVPRVAYTWVTTPGPDEFHSIEVDHDGFEIVSRDSD